ncbi:S8 family serine peptidase [Microbacterium amylolyticum]|uniref:Subtilisin family serine protease n=1 Tax=Microbacterium amylolyticum TaxID=936337 RepID=A0ABS4ZK90_9MICO|nr:S8 family serine peptidase [Microbacterium amylolyticum]MBP2437704.1 subtilisin family serine protease [Microbacterium amylolyticum]
MTRGARGIVGAAVAVLLLAAVALLPASAALAVTDETPAPVATTSPSPTPSPTPTPDPVDPIRSSQYWLEQYGIEEAWETTRGEGVTIAVIDSGVAGGIPELENAVVGGTDMSGVGTSDGRTPLGSTISTRSHGTWVASLVGSRGLADDAGVIGVAPEADILSVSLGFGAVSDVSFSEQVAEAIVWSVDNGADIINLSFTTNQTQWDESWDRAFSYAFDHDVLVVVAAGNRAGGTDVVGAPATIPGVLVVGGVDENGNASEAASTQGSTIGISGPSENLRGIGPSGVVDEWSGTSGAAPIVAGVAALVMSAKPELDAINVINQLIQTADPAPRQSGDRDPLYGFGIVDAAEAITAQLPRIEENPMGDLSRWIRINRSATSDDPGGDITPTPDPVDLPALPPPDPPAQAASPLIPTADSLREVTLPLVAISAAGILLMLGVVAVSRRIRSVRAQLMRGRSHDNSKEITFRA